VIKRLDFVLERLEKVKATAQQDLRRLGYPADHYQAAKTVISFLPGEQKTKPKRSTAERKRLRARRDIDVLVYLDLAMNEIHAGDLESAIDHSIMAVAVCFQDDAEIGRRTRKDGAKGAALREGSDRATRRAVHDRWVERDEELKKKHPSQRARAYIIAKEFGEKWPTVRDVLIRRRKKLPS